MSMDELHTGGVEGGTPWPERKAPTDPEGGTLAERLDSLRRAVQFGTQNGKRNIIVDLDLLKELFDQRESAREAERAEAGRGEEPAEVHVNTRDEYGVKQSLHPEAAASIAGAAAALTDAYRPCTECGRSAAPLIERDTWRKRAEKAEAALSSRPAAPSADAGLREALEGIVRSYDSLPAETSLMQRWHRYKQAVANARAALSAPVARPDRESLAVEVADAHVDLDRAMDARDSHGADQAHVILANALAAYRAHVGSASTATAAGGGGKADGA